MDIIKIYCKIKKCDITIKDKNANTAVDLHLEMKEKIMLKFISF